MKQPEIIPKMTRRPFNPFSMPTDTDLRFLLLILSVLCASMFFFRWIQSGYDENFASEVSACIEKSGINNLSTIVTLTSANQSYQTCLAATYERILAFVSAGVGAVFFLGLVIGIIRPTWKKYREKIILLKSDDDPVVVTSIQDLGKQIDLKPVPTLLWNPLNRSLSGVAFGGIAKPFIALTGGLVVLFSIDREAFESILLHEFAHIKNRDIRITGFTIAIWYAFLAAGLLPLLIYRVVMSLGGISSQTIKVTLGLGWRVLVLIILVYLIRNSVLQAREFYADLRVREWEGSGETLVRALKSYGDSPSNKTPKALRFHPTVQERVDVLTERIDIYRMGFLEALTAGLNGGIAFPALELFFTQLLTRWQITHLAPIFASLMLAPIIAGVVTTGIWRMVMAARDKQRPTPGIIRLALGLWLGTWIGRNLSFEQFIELRLIQGPLGNQLYSVLFSFILSMVWLALVIAFLHWVRDCAMAWSQPALDAHSVRPFYIGGLAAAGLVLTVIYGPILGAMKLAASPGEFLSTLMVNLSAIPTSVARNPLTTLVFFVFWAFYLMAYLPRWTARPNSPEAAGQSLLIRIKKAAIAGLKAGVVYCLVLLILRIIFRLTLDSIIRGSAEFRLSLYYYGIAFAVITQFLTAAIIIWKTNEGGIYLGMLAAFTAALTATAGFLIENWLFGGIVDLELTWMVFADITNLGSLAIFPLLYLIGILTKRTTKKRLVAGVVSVTAVIFVLTGIWIAHQVVFGIMTPIVSTMPTMSLPVISTVISVPTTFAHIPSTSTLSGLEKGIIGLWYRTRSSDGTDMYLRINPDRTACKWEEAHGSDERKKVLYFENWELDQANPVDQNKYRVTMIYSTGDESPWIYNTSTKQINPEEFKTINYSPSLEEKSCNP